MKVIAIQRNFKTYLPEIYAYRKYFREYKIIEYCHEHELENESVDLIWKFMGIDVHKRNIPTVHEYVSLSVGHFAAIKDAIKKYINIQPSFRIFQNEGIKKKYSFNDRVPYCYRNMGIDDIFFCQDQARKEYDFVYVGSMESNRRIDKMLNFFVRHPHLSILMIGNPSDELFNYYKPYLNIKFTGQIPYYDVPKTAMTAEYAINYIPDIYPFNMQTSTKLLEYAAMGMKILTTNYYWANQFEKERNMKFFHINEDCSNLTLEKLKNFTFKTCDLQDLRWENILTNSKIKEQLKQLL